MKTKLFLLVISILGLILFGCDNPTSTQQKIVVCQSVEDGTNIRIMTITSNKYSWISKQGEVKPNVEKIVNGGQYNVVSVKTFYSDEYLTSAEIKYSIAEDCENQNFRVIFIHSKKYSWITKQGEIKPKLEDVVNSGKYDIQDVNTIMLEGYLVAAEVFYREIN